ncbi:MAG: low molecular weight phosphotyrosine protein phosphatase [Eubacteriaceae bacterium]|nr:low molecular weight phosphotyrosine protein phosphatase [Eubacteriaceae bacterium]
MVSKPTGILFVCHGNICRSPMAEFCMKDLVSKADCAQRFMIASAATSTEEIFHGIGNPVYPPAVRELSRHGISCEGKRAVHLYREDYAKYDLIIGMDHNNLRNMRRILGDDPEGKISLLLDFTGSPQDIADPWYTGDFERTWDDILRGCTALLDELLRG